MRVLVTELRTRAGVRGSVQEETGYICLRAWVYGFDLLMQPYSKWCRCSSWPFSTPLSLTIMQQLNEVSLLFFLKKKMIPINITAAQSEIRSTKCFNVSLSASYLKTITVKGFVEGEEEMRDKSEFRCFLS